MPAKGPFARGLGASRRTVPGRSVLVGLGGHGSEALSHLLASGRQPAGVQPGAQHLARLVRRGVGAVLRRRAHALHLAARGGVRQLGHAEVADLHLAAVGRRGEAAHLHLAVRVVVRRGETVHLAVVVLRHHVAVVGRGHAVHLGVHVVARVVRRDHHVPVVRRAEGGVAVRHGRRVARGPGVVAGLLTHGRHRAGHGPRLLALYGVAAGGVVGPVRHLRHGRPRQHGGLAGVGAPAVLLPPRRLAVATGAGGVRRRGAERREAGRGVPVAHARGRHGSDRELRLRPVGGRQAAAAGIGQLRGACSARGRRADLWPGPLRRAARGGDALRGPVWGVAAEGRDRLARGGRLGLRGGRRLGDGHVALAVVPHDAEAEVAPGHDAPPAVAGGRRGQALLVGAAGGAGAVDARAAPPPAPPALRWGGAGRRHEAVLVAVEVGLVLVPLLALLVLQLVHPRPPGLGLAAAHQTRRRQTRRRGGARLRGRRLRVLSALRAGVQPALGGPGRGGGAGRGVGRRLRDLPQRRRDLRGGGAGGRLPSRGGRRACRAGVGPRRAGGGLAAPVLGADGVLGGGGRLGTPLLLLWLRGGHGRLEELRPRRRGGLLVLLVQLLGLAHRGEDRVQVRLLPERGGGRGGGCPGCTALLRGLRGLRGGPPGLLLGGAADRAGLRAGPRRGERLGRGAGRRGGRRGEGGQEAAGRVEGRLLGELVAGLAGAAGAAGARPRLPLGLPLLLLLPLLLAPLLFAPRADLLLL
mmetsp:Transcript_41693/g.90911  ORF Transcript_41693/g.90911 Transcript_41693/m.90911 type:complete len:752 (-) Transcript_41693:588-2843(-)